YGTYTREDCTEASRITRAVAEIVPQIQGRPLVESLAHDRAAERQQADELKRWTQQQRFEQCRNTRRAGFRLREQVERIGACLRKPQSCSRLSQEQQVDNEHGRRHGRREIEQGAPSKTMLDEYPHQPP